MSVHHCLVDIAARLSKSVVISTSSFFSRPRISFGGSWRSFSWTISLYRLIERSKAFSSISDFGTKNACWVRSVNGSLTDLFWMSENRMRMSCGGYQSPRLAPSSQKMRSV